MATGKRYYWIKLKDTFMTSDEVDYMMSQPDGANYVVLYQMLCLKTINTGGRLSRQIGEIIIPYDIDKIQRDCKWFSVDTIRVALELYKSFGLIYVDEDGVLVLADHKNLVGSETDYAEKKKRQRENKTPILPPFGDRTGDTTGDNVPTDVPIDIRDKEIRDKILDIKERDKEKDAASTSIYPSIIDTHTSGEEILIDTIDAKVKRNIDYDILRTEYIGGELENIVALIVDAIYSTAPTIRIGGNDIPTDSVRSRFYKLDCEHIRYVLDSMSKNSTKVRNIKAYLLTSLYNAPATISSYYTAEVNHDMKGGATGG